MLVWNVGVDQTSTHTVDIVSPWKHCLPTPQFSSRTLPWLSDHIKTLNVIHNCLIIGLSFYFLFQTPLLVLFIVWKICDRGVMFFFVTVLRKSCLLLSHDFVNSDTSFGWITLCKNDRWKFELWGHPKFGLDVSRGKACSQNASVLMCASMFLIKPHCGKEETGARTFVIQ